MRIVVDVTPLAIARTGIGNYALGMLQGLAEASGRDDEVVAFAVTGPRGRRRVEDTLSDLDVERRLVVVPPSSHTWRTVWSRFGRPAVERLVGRLDVFHFSDWMYPPQRNGVRATTIYDLVPLRFPEWVAPLTKRMHGRKYRHAARTCDVIFAISEFTAGDVSSRLNFPRERTYVAYPGVDDRFSPEGERAERDRPYVLSVATDEPRKNLHGLLDAFAVLRERHPELRLVLAGGSGWQTDDLPSGEGVEALGFVKGEELPALYRGASLFVYPSLFEGFGMPIVEAMASGVPVVSSSHPSLDEASGDAALRADPSSPEAIASAMDAALAEADGQIAAGLAHARRFTWEACGGAVLRGYRSAL